MCSFHIVKPIHPVTKTRMALGLRGLGRVLRRGQREQKSFMRSQLGLKDTSAELAFSLRTPSIASPGTMEYMICLFYALDSPWENGLDKTIPVPKDGFHITEANVARFYLLLHCILSSNTLCSNAVSVFLCSGSNLCIISFHFYQGRYNFKLNWYEKPEVITRKGSRTHTKVHRKSCARKFQSKKKREI